MTPTFTAAVPQKIYISYADDCSTIFKVGTRVRKNEEVAIKLVAKYTDLPLPKVFPEESAYFTLVGILVMSHISGLPLDASWDGLDEYTKERRFPDMCHVFNITADGLIIFTLIPLKDDTARYLYYNGRLYAEDLPTMLLRSNLSVFTHADIAPRNIIVDQTHRITGILDWEAAGWYPNYWEYINIWKPSRDHDWQTWMDRTAPRKWDRSGINAARRVLF
ncbi:hypothetical protein V2W45_1473897 [Cenococcum geophilum]